jgi:hypothetical protein
MDNLNARTTRRRPSAIAQEPPALPQVAGLPPRRIAVAKRLAMGRGHFASVLNWWLARCNYSHVQIGAVSDWALAQDGWLISSQLSHLRNNHVRQPSFTNLEALGAVNQVLHLWHTEGPRETFRAHGPFGNDVLSEELLDRGQWLKYPGTEDPLDFAGFCELFTGRVKLPYAATVSLSGHEAKRLSEELGTLLDQLADETGLSPRESITEVLRHYPVEDKARVARLRAVLLGTEVFTQQQVEAELFAISELVAGLRGLPVGTYGPQELFAELSSGRQRT